MAVPTSVSIQNLSGKYNLNKKLGNDPDALLAMQGLGFIKRKAIGKVAVTMHLSQAQGADGVYRISAKNMVGDKQMSAEERILDWQVREAESPVGKVQAKTELTSAGKIADAFLASGWDSADVIHGFATGDGWTLEQVWGFANVAGEKRHVRKLVCVKGKERKDFTLVYDYVN
ncbi:uncharacterized protein B0I36DRAFT_383385 [Microdochium trichocladiopsis]|uniref:Uncharacterized protein n=1 Tax=Microdochium trichocladiopsis TaxID=1682393 RepID=A0A9P8YA29_9PEZI|nr:uncharacterized protein B0I36DRAFT_383385 [Microdochium trichocladiopsis]KAH7033545.1 hypothetical protein B0I36DRAFT_383385 [Microdochium trichocladiopsis]